MKTFLFLSMSLLSASAFASNYPSDYCHANVKVCEDGPAIVAQITSGCNSAAYVIGYKKSGVFGANSFVDAIVNLHVGNSTATKSIRVTPDWNNLGFLTPAISLSSALGNSSNSLNRMSIAFSDGNNSWDSINGVNYQFPVGDDQANNCYTVKTNENYFSQIPLSAWKVINNALSR